MTTACWDGEELAVDSQGTEGNVISYSNKLWRWDGERGSGYFTVAGNIERDYPAMKNFLETGNTNLKPSKNYGCICVTDDGVASYITENYLVTLLDFKYAFGSGSQIAIGAMAAGKSAREAVKIAIKHDAYTGGKVRVFRPDNKKNKRTS